MKKIFPAIYFAVVFILLISPNPAQAGEAPKIVHFIWLGSPLPEKYKNNISTWSEWNLEYEFRIWMDERFLTGSSIRQEQEKFHLENVKVIDVPSVPYFHADFPSSKYLLDEYTVRNWGAASDILRVEILYLYGGIYLDTDTDPVATLPVPMSLPHDIRIGAFRNSQGNYAWTNSVIAAVPAHPVLKMMRDRLEKVYKILYNDTAELLIHRDKSHPRFKESTMTISGPGLVTAVFCYDYYPTLSEDLKKSLKACLDLEKWFNEGFGFDSDLVIIKSDNSWVRPAAEQ